MKSGHNLGNTEADIKDVVLFQETVRKISSYDFTEYSVTSLRRRLTRIVLETEKDIPTLMAMVRDDPDLLEWMVRRITVHTTELFRDPTIWIAIRDQLLSSWKDREELHIWHPGCSTGQEVYSMMMVLDEMDLLDRCSIYGTDLNPDVLEIAQKGQYKYHFNQSYLENFEKVMGTGNDRKGPGINKYWKKFFTVDEARDTIQMNHNLCLKPSYKKFDLVRDSTRMLPVFDLIVCRNVIIYFNQNLQNRVFDLFYQSLKENGVLWLGVHESILGQAERKFKKTDSFYTKVGQ